MILITPSFIPAPGETAGTEEEDGGWWFGLPVPGGGGLQLEEEEEGFLWQPEVTRENMARGG